MLPLVIAICGAASAVAGVLTTQAVKEKDRQVVQRYEKVNAELINSRDKLQQRYYELSDKSKEQINDLNLKLAESEMEKDLVYLALNLYHELMALREDIDINPCLEVLVEFHKAIILTNYVLQQLDKRLVPVTQDYFSRTLTRIDERDNLSKEQLFSFMAVLMNPQQNTVFSLLGEVQNEMFAQQYIEVKQQDDTDSYKDQEGIGEELEKYQSDLADCTKAIELNPHDASNYISRGVVYLELEDCQSALADYTKAIELDPNIDAAYYLRGGVYKELKDYQAALADYTKAITLNPHDASNYVSRGIVYYDLKNYKAALSNFNKAIELDPNDDGAYYYRGFVYKELEDYQSALADYTKAVELNPNDNYLLVQKRCLRKLENPTGLVESVIDTVFSWFD